MLLFDQNISFRVSNKIQPYFPNAKHVSDCGLLGRRDDDIWFYAKKTKYAIVTFDSDFFDFALVRGIPPKIIWLRTGNLTSFEISALLISRKSTILDFLNNPDESDAICLELFIE